jgi:hypothetical protein
VTCRHHPAATRAGINQVANAQKTTAAPAIKPRVAATMGASAISTIRAAARMVMAQAPMATQYGGLRSVGLNSYSMIRAATKMPAAA